MSKPSGYEQVTGRIIRELEEGVAPWVKPWLTGLPYNAVSQRAYSGVNVLLLWSVAAHRSYQNRAWLTFRQAKELGGHIKKGETSVLIVYTSRFTKTEEDSVTGKKIKKDIPFLKHYNVFNVEQANGLPIGLYHLPDPRTHEDISDLADTFIQAIGAKVRLGAPRAAYHPKKDTIRLPFPSDFATAAEYYATSLHEHGHWSGHPSRLNRDLEGRFGSQSYAAEELIAELTGAFLCAHLELKGKLQHAEYIGHWLELLRRDSKAIFTAARQATDAAEYLKARVREKTGAEKPAAALEMQSAE